MSVIAGLGLFTVGLREGRNGNYQLFSDINVRKRHSMRLEPPDSPKHCRKWRINTAEQELTVLSINLTTYGDLLGF